MTVLEDGLSKVVNEIKKQIGTELDLENETYVLQTPSAYVKIGFEDDDEGEKKLSVQVTGGKLTYLETDNDIFESLYGNEDDYNEWISKEHDRLH